MLSLFLMTLISLAVVLAAPAEFVVQDPSKTGLRMATSDGTDWKTQGWADPRLRGGRMLDVRTPLTIVALADYSTVFSKFTLPELGEPINVIISGLSDPFILTHDGTHALM